jgi:hypothetical protein
MMKIKLRIMIAAILLACVGIVSAQDRKVTPVENEDNKTAAPALHYYDKHGNPLKEPVLVWEEDTLATVKRGYDHPLYSGVLVGVNFCDAIMKLAGQSYGSYDVWAAVSLHNRFFPTLELGMGYADSTPKTGNYTYKGKPSFYAKLGIDYNFMFNSNPDYAVFMGVRGGFSSFSYDVKNVSVTPEYWGVTHTYDIFGEKASALYGEIVAGLRVKLFSRVSMGWSVRYHLKFKVNDADNSSPWFIPGFGGKNTPIAATLSLIYTL